MKLHLGCGYGRIDDWLNCDLYAHPNVDCAFDVQKDWPFPDDSGEAIFASHMLEHLTDPLAFFREAWRVCQHGAPIMLRMPYGGHESAWVDLSHVRPWFPDSFCCFQPGYAKAVVNPQHASWQWPFGVQAVDLRLAPKWAGLLRWKMLRRHFLRHAENVANAIEEMWVYLYPLKDEGAIHVYQTMRDAKTVPVRWCMYRHAWERRGLGDNEVPRLLHLEDDRVTILNGGE